MEPITAGGPIFFLKKSLCAKGEAGHLGDGSRAPLQYSYSRLQFPEYHQTHGVSSANEQTSILGVSGWVEESILHHYQLRRLALTQKLTTQVSLIFNKGLLQTVQRTEQANVKNRPFPYHGRQGGSVHKYNTNSIAKANVQSFHYFTEGRW